MRFNTAGRLFVKVACRKAAVEEPKAAKIIVGRREGLSRNSGGFCGEGCATQALVRGGKETDIVWRSEREAKNRFEIFCSLAIQITEVFCCEGTNGENMSKCTEYALFFYKLSLMKGGEGCEEERPFGFDHCQRCFELRCPVK